MKIISLEAKNVLKLKTVSITPDGSAVIIGGKNAQGKSSVLNCIMAAIGGKKYVAEKAVREGEKKGFIQVDLGLYKVRRTFVEGGGGSVIVETAEGARFSSPQSILDGLLSAISFDPLMFAKMDTKGQLEILKTVSGIDTTELDREYAEVFDERADSNRDIKRFEGQLEGKVRHEDAPAEIVSVSAISEEHRKALETNLDNKSKRDLLDTRKTEKTDLEEEAVEFEKEMKELQAKIDLNKKSIIDVGKSISKGEKIVNKLTDIDTNEITERLNGVEEVNQKVRDNESITATEKELQSAKDSSAEKSKRLLGIKEEKVKLVAESDLPISDLLFDEDGITFQDIPFEQASEAEKLRVSVSLGLAMNPKLKVMLIRDGSLLDEDNLAVIAKMAEDADGQVWIERVGTGDEMTVIMEDGEIIQPKK